MVDYVKLKDEDDINPKRVLRRKKPRINFKSILIIIILVFIISSIISSVIYSLTPKIAVVPISGSIMTQRSSTLYGEAISSREIADIIRQVGDDSTVKGIVIDINSPGGSPVASDEISNVIDEVKKKKPVYALINDVGASGGFWIAMSADKIYASSMSTVGSIGVTATGFGLEDLMKEYNISYRRYVAGDKKDMGSAFREPTEEENEIISNILDEIHNNFIEHVANNRNMSKEEVESYATGEIFLGSYAKEIGFIDEIGYYPDVLEDIKNKTDSQNAIVVDFRPQPTLSEIFGLNSLFESPQTNTKVLLK
jgi:protease-4